MPPPLTVARLSASPLPLKIAVPPLPGVSSGHARRHDCPPDLRRAPDHPWARNDARAPRARPCHDRADRTCSWEPAEAGQDRTFGCLGSLPIAHGVRSCVRNPDSNRIGARSRNMTGTFRDVNSLWGCYRVIPFDSNSRRAPRRVVPRAMPRAGRQSAPARCACAASASTISNFSRPAMRCSPAGSRRKAHDMRWSCASAGPVAATNGRASWSSSRRWRTCSATRRCGEARNTKRRTKRLFRIMADDGADDGRAMTWVRRVDARSRCHAALRPPPADRSTPLRTRDRPRGGC